MSNEKFLFVYLFFINFLTIFLFSIDKTKAVLQKWRIPEKPYYYLHFLVVFWVHGLL